MNNSFVLRDNESFPMIVAGRDASILCVCVCVCAPLCEFQELHHVCRGRRLDLIVGLGDSDVRRDQVMGSCQVELTKFPTRQHGALKSQAALG